MLLQAAHNHGFLLWLNTPPTTPSPSPATDDSPSIAPQSCCSLAVCAAPRGAASHPSWLIQDTSKNELEGQLVPGAPAELLVSAGRTAKLVLGLPADNTVVVSLGFTWPETQSCLLSVSNYDGTIALATIYEAPLPCRWVADTGWPHGAACSQAMQPVLAKHDAVREWRSDIDANPGAPTPKGLLVHPAEPPPVAADTVLAQTAAVQVCMRAMTRGASVASNSGPVPQDTDEQADEQAGDDEQAVGSVSCTCPPHEGFGQCIDLTSKDVNGATTISATKVTTSTPPALQHDHLPGCLPVWLCTHPIASGRPPSSSDTSWGVEAASARPWA